MMLTTRYLHKAPFHLEAMALELPQAMDDNPNRIPFRGVLTRIDEPSTKPPGGAQGHRVLIPRAVAIAAGPSIIGMPIDCAWNLKDHDKKRNIGVIDTWEIQGNDFLVNGHLFGKSYPEDIKDIQDNKDSLGMSYEVSDVDIVDANAPIWTLEHFIFTGGAVLEKNAAAYQQTSIAAAAEEDDMADSAVLEAVKALHAKVDGIQAAVDASADEEEARRDEEDAKRADEEAAASVLAAKRARDDGDEEDAARHEESAAKSHTDAYAKRAKAMQWHASMAAKAREVKEDEAAARHDEAAAKLKEEDAARRKEDEDAAKMHQEEEAAKAKGGDGDAMTQMLGMMMRAMLDKDDEQASAKPSTSGHPTEEMFNLMGKMFHAMTYGPSVTQGKKKTQAAAAHDDVAEDTALFKRLIQQYRGNDLAAGADLRTRREIREMRASMELLTDTVKKLTGLITDGAQQTRGLATDVSRGNNGGTAPTRRTMHATTEAWVGKYDSADAHGKKAGQMTVKELDAQMEAEGLTIQQQIARKIEMQAQGLLVS